MGGGFASALHGLNHIVAGVAQGAAVGLGEGKVGAKVERGDVVDGLGKGWAVEVITERIGAKRMLSAKPFTEIRPLHGTAKPLRCQQCGVGYAPGLVV